MTSFTVSFVIARAFTFVNPDVVLLGGGYHIHHFWYGLAMLVIGGWIGINYSSDQLDRFAAILFGASGGLVSDEVGLLLTLGNYDASVTYNLVVSFIALASVAILLNQYRQEIADEIREGEEQGHRLLHNHLRGRVSDLPARSPRDDRRDRGCSAVGRCTATASAPLHTV